VKLDGPVPGVPGATIREVAVLPDQLPNAQPTGLFGQAIKGQLLLDVPNVGRYLVRDGMTIDIAPAKDADPGLVVLHALGSARGAIIHQRGEFPLHAATLVPPGGLGAFAICGNSGAGKSTLATELSRRGWALVADDTTRVTWTDNQALAWPSLDSIKLWQESCELFGIDSSKLKRVSAQLEKFYLHVPARDEPVILAAIVELAPEGPEHPRDVVGAKKIARLLAHTFRPGHVRPLGQLSAHVAILEKIAGACRVLEVRGGKGRPIAQLANEIEHFADQNGHFRIPQTEPLA
jgi:hypothetical protein